MKVSVLIIAHNEEKYIAECIESILNQTQKADEIVLLLHNSTDRTLEIAQKYPIKIIPYHGPKGIIYARLEGIKNTTGDILLCIDGDSYAVSNWVSVLTSLLNKENILVGSWVKFKGTFYGELSNNWNKIFCNTKNNPATLWLWGPSLGFWSKDKNKVLEILKECLEINTKLNLSRTMEDYILAYKIAKIGKIEVTNKTYVTNYTKEKNSIDFIKRSSENIRNWRKVNKYLN